MDRIRSHHCLAGHDFRREWERQPSPAAPSTPVTFSSRDSESQSCYGLTPISGNLPQMALVDSRARA